MTDIEVKGLVEARASIRATARRARRESKAIIQSGARAGYAEMYEKIPQDKGNLRSRLFLTEPKYTPGGAGGGGTWTAEVALASEETKWGHDIGELILRGTGLHGPHMHEISATSGGNPYNTFPMKDWGGHTLVFRQSHRGMFPQTRWVDEGQRAADDKVDLLVRSLAAQLAARG